MQPSLFYDLVCIKAAVAAKRQGLDYEDLTPVVTNLPTEVVDQLIIDNNIAVPTFPTSPPAPTTGKGASGQLIAALIAFLNSPAGQALEAALVQLLISLIAGGG